MSFFARLKEGLAKTRQLLNTPLEELFIGGKVDEALLEELEDQLVMADFGVETASAIVREAKERLDRKQKKDANAMREALRDTIRAHLEAVEQGVVPSQRVHPWVILVVGVNGVGKTTTIGKLAAFYQSNHEKVLLAAGDTYRAAAVAQLQKWGERCGCLVISQGQDADAASVVHDAFAAARARRYDVLIADTAGRLHTKSNLMEELKKIKRVLGRLDPSAPHETLLVLDGTTGQNAISQVQKFHEAIGITGLVITKLDGTAKGGVVVGLSEKFKLPVRYIGVGEGLEDLRPFDPRQFVEALF
ncbi:MAG: signal recognition particle-docking protein FtsY [Magnetococcales bacterium]|nr:signal recognition particle-docking protein FtsY [Magnetococcales bacterium]NGZ05323.1 signal recognition particle-docking protein FtsY [Magnetococcales bacterium]